MNKNDLRTALIALLCSIIVVGVYHFGKGLCCMLKDDCSACPKPILVQVIGFDGPCAARQGRCGKNGFRGCCPQHMQGCPAMQQQRQASFPGNGFCGQSGMNPCPNGTARPNFCPPAPQQSAQPGAAPAAAQQRVPAPEPEDD